MDPLDLFRSNPGNNGSPIEIFSHSKSITSFQPLRLYHKVPTEGLALIPGPETKKVGNYEVSLSISWKTIDGASVPCDGVAVEIGKEYTVGMQTTLTEQIESTLTTELGVDGIGKVGTSLTASLGISVTTSSETKTTRKLTVEPPATGTKSVELLQPVVRLMFVRRNEQGDTVDFFFIDVGLSYVGERVSTLPTPKCPDDEGEGKKKTGMLEKELDKLNGMEKRLAAHLKKVGIETPAQLLLQKPAAMAMMGIPPQQANAVYNAAHTELEQETRALYEITGVPGQGGGGLADLKRRLEQLSTAYDEAPAMLRGVGEMFEKYDIDAIRQRIDAIIKQEGKNAPDDLGDELRKLEEKIRRLGNKDNYEYKYPFRMQISIAVLISIFLELLDILRKLYGRSIPNPTRADITAVKKGKNTK